MARKDTWLHILRTGSELVHRQGFQSTGLNDVLRAARVPKGSFYHYFKSKEDFGLQLVDFYAGYLTSRLERSLGDEKMPPLERLRRFFDEFGAFCREQNFSLGCPLGNLAQEMGDLNESFSRKIEAAFGTMRDMVAACLAEAQKDGAVDPSLHPKETADFLLNAWEGSLLRMKVTRNPDPLEGLEKMIFSSILK
jgi:TetR/AcrR family transcriptional repressor of nem operon